jgi:capsule polysaccharide export protein KpsE/RkpR
VGRTAKRDVERGAQINAGQITRERERLAKAAAAMAKADQPKPTDPVAIDHQIAEKRLEAALKGFQEAQMEVGRAQRYLVVLDGPSRPDTASFRVCLASCRC